MILTGVDQLWVADITYIRLEEEFVYLAVILDAYSRRVIGWHLDRRTGQFADADGAAHGAAGADGAAGAGPSFRSRRAVRQRRIHATVEGQRHRDQHEPQGEPLGQGLRFILHLLGTANDILWESAAVWRV